MSVWQDDYKWHFDYKRLVTDAGFGFGRKKLQSFNKTKLASIDIESIIKDCDIGIVEKYIPVIVQFVLDPEQTELLDSSFVKIFQMSQLCIEYLLYCKKHLDSTVYLLKQDFKKLQNENKELNEFVAELKAHIGRLTSDLKPSSIFQCNECSKLFSTEEYLNEHIKRRHTNNNQSNTLKNDPDNDKLHSEIKELKGRLNSTEKLLKEYQKEIECTKETKNNDLLRDIQQKIDDLRVEVEGELKDLQKHYNFEEKCEKFFGKALENIEQLQNKKINEIEQIKVRCETAIQTDHYIIDQPTKPDEKIDEIGNIEKQIKEIGDTLDTKVTSSLQKFENQMQPLWQKFREIEEICKNSSNTSELPVVKPRTKLPTHQPNKDQTPDVETSPVKVRQRQRWIKHDNVKANPVIVEVARNVSDENSGNSESENDEEIEDSPPPITEKTEESPIVSHDFKENTVQNEDRIEERSIENKSPIHVIEPKESSPIRQVQEQSVDLVRKSLTPRKPNKKASHSIDKKPVIIETPLEMSQIDIENLINRHLQDLGISPEWQGIPLKTYQQASEIIEHQTNLMKKSIPKFNKISKQVQKDINKRIEEQQGKNRRKCGGNHKKFTKSIHKTPAQVEIKNRKLYETDSESVDGRLNETKPVTRYSAVIEELRNKSKLLDTDQTRSVLKNYPSYASLTKKRVNFDLKHDSDDKIDDNDDNRLVVRDGGSTTSVESLVFDATPRKLPNNKSKDIEIVSDFDLSDS